MDVLTINGQKADIILESETNVRELLSGLDSWITGSGLYVSGLEIDGTAYGASLMDEAFALRLNSVSRIDVRLSSWAELMLEALIGIQNDLETSDEEAWTSSTEWNTAHTAAFLRENAADIHALVTGVLDGKIKQAEALPLIAERIRELRNPAGEIAASLPIITEISDRLEDLPLDIQTGKDARAAQTITLFSGITEKLFRLLFLLQRRGVKTESISALLSDFSAAVKELYAAYENRDTVLVGDLAEYELAPRLPELASRLGELAASGVSSA